jgi:hypothetical protein
LRGSKITDSVEGLVVAHDLEEIAGTGLAQPPSCIHGDAQVAPILNAGDRSTVDESRTRVRKNMRRLNADDAPVADRGELASSPVGEPQVLKHGRDVSGTARVLHVEEDGAAGPAA